MDQSHPGTKCSSCKADPIVGVRMACLICKRYDLCGECHSKKRFSRKHRSYHPVQTILPPNEMERSLKDVHQDEIRIFRCPCCGDDELNVRELIGHCGKYHASGHDLVHCPICISEEWQSDVWQSEQTRNILRHLKWLHFDENVDSWDEVESEASSDEEKNLEDIESEDEKCCICQESMKAEDCRKLTCSHSYHRECINQWLRDNNSCPNCRAEV
ncbi:E3 ubiquitin-protein ligase Kcmf1-like isoform X1 [Culex pipiens pallens]|uniref:E3 ubiquitin-protein ligase Kcmf1-like isoform X1 n=1 Tax=Culex pipiens pallens TaxID=42434 RepID=UPI0022AA4A5E|nr:E3 ubiquitin-protein ligase Kcmf1-like isoform X1 [Culex pipiens pallens]